MDPPVTGHRIVICCTYLEKELDSITDVSIIWNTVRRLESFLEQIFRKALLSPVVRKEGKVPTPMDLPISQVTC
jgi:hypothetical protein